MHESIICAGFGGQGIMLMGKLLAGAALRKGYNVTWLPSYGAEVRGGTAHSMVRISDKKIAAPVVFKPTSGIVMNAPSLKKFIGKIQKGGLLLINTSMTESAPNRKDIKTISLPFTKLASDLGNIKTANMIASGVFIRKKKFLSLELALEELHNMLPFKKELLEINKKAVKLGYELGGKS